MISLFGLGMFSSVIDVRNIIRVMNTVYVRIKKITSCLITFFHSSFYARCESILSVRTCLGGLHCTLKLKVSCILLWFINGLVL